MGNPMENSIDDPNEIIMENSAELLTENMLENLIDHPRDNSIENLMENSIENLMKKLVENPMTNLMENNIGNFIENPIENVMENPVYCSINPPKEDSMEKQETIFNQSVDDTDLMMSYQNENLSNHSTHLMKSVSPHIPNLNIESSRLLNDISQCLHYRNFIYFSDILALNNSNCKKPAKCFLNLLHLLNENLLSADQKMRETFDRRHSVQDIQLSVVYTKE
ncbi:hypothetical protein SNEBB_003229 [Seison nebaliae]|nr:hypothetical protein SNEBB_003229 [Seison nebaliae]